MLSRARLASGAVPLWDHLCLLADGGPPESRVETIAAHFTRLASQFREFLSHHLEPIAPAPRKEPKAPSANQPTAINEQPVQISSRGRVIKKKSLGLMEVEYEDEDMEMEDDDDGGDGGMIFEVSHRLSR